VVTGFIGATPDGRITTLGRNSSDFSGAIVAHVVDADELVIWTDVDGIYTANPAESAEARLLHELSYDEAHALAASGAKVLHAKVLPLAAKTEMVVWVRNTFNPQARGTRIGTQRSLQDSRTASQDSVPIRSISTQQGGAAEFPISKRRRSKYAREAAGEKVEGGSPWRYRSCRSAPRSNARQSSVV